MNLQPIPCLSTELDRFELADLRMRLESLAARIVAGGEPKSAAGGGLSFVTDAHGRITMQQQMKALVIGAEAWQGMGGLKLTMPMPASRDERQAKTGRLSKEDLVRLLYTWLGYVDAEPSGTSARPALGSSGYVRLVSQVSALICAANPQIEPGARFTVVPSPAYEEETDMHSSTRIPALLSGSKQIIASDLERTLLRLHPGALIERNQSTRSFRLAVREPFQCRIADIGIAETMRAIGDLGVRNHVRPVLKAGLDLR